MRFYAKLFAILLVGLLCVSISGHFRNMSRLREIVARPTSDHEATREMHAMENEMGWDIARADFPETNADPTTAPTTQP